MSEFTGDEVVAADVGVVASDDLYSNVNAGLLRRGLRVTAFAWRTAWHVVSGFKTLLSCGAVGLLGLYDQLGGGDLIATLKNQFGDNAKLGSILIGVAILFTLLRFATNSKVGGAKSSDDGDTTNP